MSEPLTKICALALVCAAVGIICKSISEPLSSAIKLGGGILVFSMAVITLSGALDETETIVARFDGYSDITNYWGIMLRALGIAFLCRICSDVCRDCGESTVAGGVETAGKITILAISLPMVEDVLSSAEQLLASV